MATAASPVAGSSLDILAHDPFPHQTGDSDFRITKKIESWLDAVGVTYLEYVPSQYICLREHQELPLERTTIEPINYPENLND